MKITRGKIPRKATWYDLPQVITLVIADDHAYVRNAIRRLVSRSPRIQILGEAKNGYEAIDLVEKLHPDVLLLDLEMPGYNGLQVTKKIISEEYSTRILILSAYAEQTFIQNSLDLGAKGYLTKDEAPDQILQAIKAIAADQNDWLSARARQSLLD